MVGTQTLSHALGAGFGTQQRCVGVVLLKVFLGFGLAATFLVVEVGSQIVQIHELYTRFFYHLTVPGTIRVVTTLNPTVLPLVARGE